MATGREQEPAQGERQQGESEYRRGSRMNELVSKLDGYLRNSPFEAALSQQLSLALAASQDDNALLEHLLDFFEANVPAEVKNRIYHDIEELVIKKEDV